MRFNEWLDVEGEEKQSPILATDVNHWNGNAEEESGRIEDTFGIGELQRPDIQTDMLIA